MAVLVTGGAGYLGAHIVLALLDAGHECVVVDDLSSGQERPFLCHDQGLWEKNRQRCAYFVQGSILDRAVLDACLGHTRIDAVIHLAALVSLARSVADPLPFYMTNLCATGQLAAHAMRHGAGCFIFASSGTVYAPAQEGRLSEQMPLAPVAPYGTSKMCAELLLRDHAATGAVRLVVLRCFNIAGADPQLRAGPALKGSTHLVAAACETARRAAGGQSAWLHINGTDYRTPDGTAIRDYVHVSDVADAFVKALDHLRGGGPGGVFNCGTGKGHSVLQVIRAVEEVSGTRLATRAQPRRAGDAHCTVAVPDRAREILGWHPRFANLHTMIDHTLAWDRHCDEGK